MKTRFELKQWFNKRIKKLETKVLELKSEIQELENEKLKVGRNGN